MRPVVPRVVRTSRMGGPGSEPWGRTVSSLGVANSFNPSMIEHAGVRHVVFRGYGPDRAGPFRAYHHVETPGCPPELHDLTAVAAEGGVGVVADPKLTVLQGSVYATFNSGYSGQENSVHLMRLWPEIGPPQELRLDDRRRVEKNWGFFDAAGEVFVLYDLAPIQLLGISGGSLGAPGPLTLRRLSSNGSGVPRPLSIGPQPVVLGDDLLVVGHEKLYLRGRRGYVGRPVRITDAASPRAAAHQAPVRLIHSWRDLRIGAVRHNPNLLFATYFSGLYTEGDRIVLGYGINDVRAAFAETEVERLWL